MNLGSYNISDIMEVIYRALSGASSNIFLFERPKVHDNMDDFIVIDLPNRVYDNLANGVANCVIELYAKDTSNGPNMPLLASLQERVYERLPIEHELCKVHRPISQAMGSDKLGFHSVFIYCKVLIK